MSIKLIRAARGGVVALTTLFAVAWAIPAHASGSTTYNDVNIDIHGGNASAVAACVNFAKINAKQGRTPRSNACKNFAHASGGSVSLDGVSVFVDQEGSGRRTHNNVSLNISGGDATAVAACVNFLQGSASSSEVNQCKNAADAHGGNVDLNNVDITVIQLG